MNWRSWICLTGAALGLSFSAGSHKVLLAAAHYAVLINEFLPDPDPSAGLPGWSFIELKNVSAEPVNLQGWTIGNGKKTAVIRTEIILAADSLVILCPLEAENAFASFGSTLALAGFPALSHVSGALILAGPEEEVIDAVSYDRTSFNDPVKAEGGWSLERIDASKPCAGKSNWTASIDAAGGTPGKENATAAILPPGTENHFVRSYCPDSMHVLLLLDGPVDAATAADPARYHFSPEAAGISDASALMPFFDQILLTLEKPLKKSEIYRLNIAGITGCGEAIAETSLRTGLPVAPDSGDLRFNEILFNPPSYGSDYIELYHAGKHIIDLQNVWLASRDAGGKAKDPHPVFLSPWLLFPGDYLVVTEDAQWVLSNYLVKNPSQLLELASLPSMPDDNGIIVLLDAGGNRIDELAYDHQWHSPLIADESGVALEKMGFDLPTSQAGSWTSAASTAGYGTPTYINSESMVAGYDSSHSSVSVKPEVFSPDNDGYNDFCFVTVRTEAPGFTANISIFDINGVAVRQIAANATLANEGKFRWDGFDSNGNRLPSGPYVAFTEIFSLTGKVKQFKKLVVLARKR